MITQKLLCCYSQNLVESWHVGCRGSC